MLNKFKRQLMVPVHVYRILRAMVCLWLLKRLTHPEFIPLTMYGRYIAAEGDIACINNVDGTIQLGEVDRLDRPHDTVYMRLFRRPK